jgi:hypothetical protein
MRSRALLVPIIALLLLSCSDDDGGAPSADDAQAIVDAALLDADDLGGGWELTSTTPAGEDGDDAGFQECAPDSIDMNADDLASSEAREFTLEGELLPTTVQVSASATADRDLLGDIHALLGDAAFKECVGAALEESLGSQPGAEMTVGEIASENDVVDVDGISSTQLDIPLTISASGLDVEMEITIVFITTGHVGALLFIGAPIDGGLSDDEIDDWATLLAERISD